MTFYRKLFFFILVFTFSILIFYSQIEIIHAFLGQRNSPYYENIDFDKPHESGVNISGFAFRDINRNGIFDHGEFPVVGVFFRVITANPLTQSGPHQTQSPSNRSGWANFFMSNSLANAAITSIGRYKMIALPPPGMKISSDNKVQKFEVSYLSGAIGDLRVNPMPKPVGFVPDLWIDIQIPEGETGYLKIPKEIHLTESLTRHQLIGPSPVVFQYKIGEQSLVRSIEKQSYPVVFSKITSIERQKKQFEKSQKYETFSVDFSDLMNGVEAHKVPSNYHRLKWHNFTGMHKKFSEGAGFSNGAVSGPYIAYTSSGQKSKIYSKEKFNFISGHFSIGWERRHGEKVVIKGFNENELVYSDSFKLSAYVPVFFQAEYLGITSLTIESTHSWQVILDKLTFQLPKENL